MKGEAINIEQRTQRLVIAVLVISIVILALFFISVPNKEYVALYFAENDVNNPSIVDKVTFSFAVENHFASEKSFPYKIIYDENVVATGDLQVSANSKAVQQITIPFDKNSFSQSKVAVILTDSNQEIFFNAGLRSMVTFDNNIALVNASFYPKKIRIDENFKMDFSWVAVKSIDKNYMIFIHFFDMDNKLVYQYDHYPQVDGNIVNTTSWVPNEIFVESFVDTLPSDLEDGNYSMQIGWYIPGSQQVKTKMGDNSFEVEVIEVTR